MSILGRVRRKLDNYVSARRGISRLLKHPDSTVQSLGAALQAHLGRELTNAEANRIAAIEVVREELSHSTERLAVPDFGAGSPSDAPRAAGAAGIPTTEILGEACKNYSKSKSWATLLFHLVRKIRPANCVELGTCVGISAAYQGAALALNGDGHFTTLEGAPSFARVASGILKRLGVSDRVSVIEGRFQDTLPRVLAKGAVDYAFIDGHHDENATIGYYRQFLPHLAAHAVLIFDDIRWSSGMSRAWMDIRDDPGVDVSVDLFGIGICVVGAGVKERHDFELA